MTKQTRRDINLVVAGAVQQHKDEGWVVGLDDNHVFLMTQGQVFRIRVEEIEKITNHPEAERVALDFMRTLPYGPD